MQKTIYYKDELNDYFAGMNIKMIPLRKNYRYVHKNIIWKIIEFFVYRLLAQPLVTLFMKFVYFQNYRNRKVFKGFRGGGYIYSNHTSTLPDVFIPYSIRPSGFVFPSQPVIFPQQSIMRSTYSVFPMSIPTNLPSFATYIFSSKSVK